MGIKGLTKLIADKAPDAIREGEIGNYFSENQPNPRPLFLVSSTEWRAVCTVGIDTSGKLNGHIERR